MYYMHNIHKYILKLPDMSQRPTSPFPKRGTSGPGIYIIYIMYYMHSTSS